MSGQILFTDLDDTLLNDRKEVTPGSRRAIEAALARGKRIVVASGRPLSSALIQARRLELAGPGDAVVLAGKGHEGYIEARGTRRAFSEWAVLEEYFRGTAKPAG